MTSIFSRNLPKNHSHSNLNEKQQLLWFCFAFITRNMGQNTATKSLSVHKTAYPGYQRFILSCSGRKFFASLQWLKADGTSSEAARKTSGLTFSRLSGDKRDQRRVGSGTSHFSLADPACRPLLFQSCPLTESLEQATSGSERFHSPFLLNGFHVNQSQRASSMVITWTGT